MNALFFAQQEIWEGSGISKKILSQCKGLADNGIEVSLCHLKSINGSAFYVVDDEVLLSLGKGRQATFRYYTYFSPIIDYVKKHNINLVYIRYIHTATPFFVSFLRDLKSLGVFVLMEIPTFPYDLEHVDNHFKRRVLNRIERFSRKFFYKYIDRVVTVQDYEEILGVPTIKISNGIDINGITLRKPRQHSSINFLCVANMAKWHGYDRLIEGIGLYYKNGGKEDVHFYLVGGNSRVINAYNSIAFKYDIGNRIHFEGIKVGKELDAYFDIADLAIGALGVHRKGLSDAKPLKCIEYATRGIPFIYSSSNSDFDNKKYIMKVSPDESPINIQEIIDFLKDIRIEPSEIRKSVENKCTWDYQMSLVLKEINR